MVFGKVKDDSIVFYVIFVYVMVDYRDRYGDNSVYYSEIEDFRDCI